MKTIEKIRYTVYTEIDQYINTIYKNTDIDPKVRDYIRDVVIPRFNTLRERIIELEKELEEGQQ